MSKAIVLANGNILVGLNNAGFLRDFYYPFVGHENHVRSPMLHKIAVWDSGHFSSLDNKDEWETHIDLQPSTAVSKVEAKHRYKQVTLSSEDCVYNEKNIFVRKVTITNEGDYEKDIRLYFHQVFGIYGTPGEDTAYYDPTYNAIIHYEGRRVFLVYAETSDTPFSQYTVGLYMSEGKEGTYKDAEDGELSKNGIEHGHVDSTLGLTYHLKPKESRTYYYWITVAETKQDALDLHAYVKYKTAEHIVDSTKQYWKAWVHRNEQSFADLSEKTIDLYEKSLLYIRAHIDNNGAIIASSDSDILQYGRDTYSYMWPRDGALTVLALLEAGEYSVSKRFFKFCCDVLETDGYLMHKYRSDRSLGSSWEPFVHNEEKVLPIQEDETALILVALWRYYEKTKEIEFIESHYANFIKKMGNFLSDFIEDDTALPKPSYDLWEEKFGTTTFTSSTVYGGLLAAANFAELLGKDNDARMYRKKALGVKEAIISLLYRKDIGMFAKMYTKENGGLRYDDTVDISSIYGVLAFGVLDIKDELITTSMKTILSTLRVNHATDGFSRYYRDRYYQVVDGLGNPWYITTLWYAQYLIEKASTLDELREAKYWFSWVEKQTKEGGVMSEQLNPLTGEHLSAGPLTWSHAEFINTVLMYIKRYRALL
jgi:GH15 family glucan-1,4-alpha-glucosidase